MTISPDAEPLYAAVELGSGSFRLHVASCAGGAVRVLATLNEPIRLGAELDAGGHFRADAMRRALACLRQFRTALELWRPRAVRVVATAALRVARNAPVFVPAAASAIGHPVEVIGPEEEGRLVYLGVAGALGNAAERRLVLDIGSGSTEVAAGRGERVERVQSFGVGALRHGLAFFGEGIDPDAFDAALESSRSRFADAGAAPGMRGWERAYGASGSVRLLAELAGELLPAASPLYAGRLYALRRALIEDGGLVRIAARWSQPGQAAQVAGSLAMLLALVEELGIDAVLPVQAGLRAGVIRELHLRTQMDAQTGTRMGTESGACCGTPYRECA